MIDASGAVIVASDRRWARRSPSASLATPACARVPAQGDTVGVAPVGGVHAQVFVSLQTQSLSHCLATSVRHWQTAAVGASQGAPVVGFASGQAGSHSVHRPSTREPLQSEHWMRPQPYGLPQGIPPLAEGTSGPRRRTRGRLRRARTPAARSPAPTPPARGSVARFPCSGDCATLDTTMDQRPGAYRSRSRRIPRRESSPALVLVGFRRIVIESPLSPEEVAANLSEVVAKPRGFLFEGPTEKTYRGRVSTESFEVSRVLGYQNSFAPMIRGRIEPDDVGSLVEIRLALRPLVALFSVFWMALALLGTVLSRGAAVFLPIVFIVMLTLAFGYEARRSERFFRARLARTR